MSVTEKYHVRMFLKNRHIYKYLLGAKLALLALFCFSPPVLPHFVRQVDTMAITLRYWLRWSLEETTRYPLLPAYLGEADGYGIQFMEFPILNILLAPSFAFGVEAGRVIANFLLIALNLGLIYWAYRKWKGVELDGVKADDAFLLIPLLGASAMFFYKQVPDFTASMLVLLGLGFSINEHRRNFFASFLLVALGALIKPPQVVALAPLLLHPNRKYILKSFVWIIPAAIPCVLYYTWGSQEIMQLFDTSNHFGTHIRNPLLSIQEFFTHPIKILNFINEVFFGRFVILPIFLVLILQRRFRVSPLIIILGLQTIFLAFLDGDHLFIHRYYLCGASFVCALLFIKFTNLAPRWGHILTFIALVAFNIEPLIYQVRPIFENNMYKQCSELKAQTPQFPWGQNYGFRSHIREVPSLGLCFGEREGSQKNKYGMFLKKESFPETCQKVAESKHIILAECEVVGD